MEHGWSDREVADRAASAKVNDGEAHNIVHQDAALVPAPVSGQPSGWAAAAPLPSTKPKATTAAARLLGPHDHAGAITASSSLMCLLQLFVGRQTSLRSTCQRCSLFSPC
jgi:hypothetical protein